MSPFNRNKTNFYIDIAMFIVMGGLIGIGILIKYVLISGQERWLVYGRNLELTFWGLDRHQWGTVHLILGITLFGLLVLHIIFHWKQITCYFRRYIAPLPLRGLLAVLTIVIFILLVIFPIWVSPEKEQLDKREGRRSLENMGVNLNDSVRIRLKRSKILEEGEELHMEVEHKHRKRDIEITGNMTLNEISRQFNVELPLLKNALNLPEEVSPNERVGRLRKRHNFTRGDVKSAVIEHGKE